MAVRRNMSPSTTKYTLIIPHHNSPQLLQRCLDSVPMRKDLEIIVIDDNSDPAIVDFSQFPGRDRSDTTLYFTKEGRGAGYARNVGLDHARGEWILFADADDYFYTENLIKLLDMDIPDEYDVVAYGARYVCSDKSEHWYGAYNDKEPDSTVIVDDTHIPFLYRRLVTPWIKMVKRSLIQRHGIRFEEVMYGNDEVYSARVALAVKHFGKVNLPIYHYEKLSTGLVGSTDIKALMIRWDGLLLKELLIKQGGYSVYDQSLLFYEAFQKHRYRLIRCAIKEGCTLGWRKAWRDYSEYCRSHSISRIPFI